MEKDILALMLQQYDSFTRSERKIVDYVLEHRNETQYLSIIDLSAECEAAVSTVSLFCRKLKLAGFNDFKLELARAARLILVTRYLNSPASAYTDTVLLCGPNEQTFQFGSSAALVAQLYVVEVLLGEFIRRDPEGAERRRQSVGKALTQKCV